ncbi:tripartite motif-containing protein 2-like [Saccostrea cucullata]|uniref:tripartite motif-containing protein 2-like n=1 Tax=Saccostrea cuccullata TaxID=36930 RepID=UPI002ED23A9A
MASSNSAQDVRCDICKDAKVQMHCDFCHVNLCINCIGKHVSDNYDNHRIVAYEQRDTISIYPRCATHKGKSCEFHCKKCNTCLCSFCTTVADTHKGHPISVLTDIYISKREAIEKDIDELAHIISPTFEEIATGLESEIANLDKEYEKLSFVLSKHGEEWHREINNIVDKMKMEIEAIKIKHTNILKNHLDEMKQKQNLIQETLLKVNRIEKSNYVSMFIEYSSKNKELSNFPPKFQVTLPTFSPQTINTKQLNELFGSLTPLSITKDENGYKLKKLSAKELLREPKLITSIDTGFENLQSVTCQNEGEIWTNARNNSDMKCFDSGGSLIKTVKTESDAAPFDIALTRDGDLLYSDGKSRTLNKTINEEKEEMIRLKNWVPKQLCITSSGDLLVTMCSDDFTQSKVVRFSGCTMKQTIQFDNEGKPLYSGNNKMKYITENRNLNICLADSGANAVVVVNKAGKLRFRYTGHPCTNNTKPFQPIGITTDSQCQILTADEANNCIHILDKDGQFLGFIGNCNLKNPYGIYVNKNDDLYIAENTGGKVKKIQYLK